MREYAHRKVGLESAEGGVEEGGGAGNTLQKPVSDFVAEGTGTPALAGEQAPPLHKQQR